MERADELLNKYFGGTSTLSEEKELKDYFNSKRVSENHVIYKPLFQQFTAEKEEIYPEVAPILRIEKPKNNRNKILIWTISGVAACLLAITLVKPLMQSEDYLIMKGKRIDNPELAQQIAIKKMEKSLSMVNRRLEPVEKLGEVEMKLEKIEKISQIRQNVQNKLSKIK
ncbi:MAG TPA: hypothetical protein PKH58_10940 [Paludibacteraceae bacterium]|nr:hypothetical protein [Paludibacteraceae bacterium]HPT44164.1 hypothetical protein [Paludibacteraceae bacterium]